MKSIKWIVPVCVMMLSLGVQAQDNTLTAAEKKQGWKLLFDGKTTDGWHNYNNDNKIDNCWKVINGELVLDVDAKTKGVNGNIITNEEFENYEFTVEWNISECGNSGILFNVIEDKKYGEPYLTGPEMQIADACHPDARIIKHQAGNLYDLIASTTVSLKPAGQWNVSRILVNKGHLEFWQNGVKQIETTMFTPEWDALIKESKFKNWEGFGKAKKGKIALQDHGNKIAFKNIKIRVIK